MFYAQLAVDGVRQASIQSHQLMRRPAEHEVFGELECLACAVIGEIDADIDRYA